MSDILEQNKSTEVLILGAGLTGLTAAYSLGARARVVEALDEPGGTAGSLRYKGFALDYGVHILYFRDPDTRRWIEEELNVPLEKTPRRCGVYMDDRLTPFPVQFHLGGLSWPQRLRYGLSALTASLFSSNKNDVTNLTEWAQSHFGDALTQDFFRPYNEKLWGTSIDRLRTEWMEGFVPKPAWSKILRGLYSRRMNPYGINAMFWYPKAGGISTVSRALAEKCPSIDYNKRLVSLDIKKRVARFHDGDAISYRHLLSTIPLQRLVETIEPAGDMFERHGVSLRCNPTSVAHVLVPRPNVGNGWHWIYVPDRSIPFYRITFPHNINSANCPAGWSALSLEFGRSVKDIEATERKSIDALIRMGFLQPSERNAEIHWNHVDFGYVVYDDAWMESRKALLTMLREYDVICQGRYGRWEYSNMESSLLQGREIQKRLDRQPSLKTAETHDFPKSTSPTYQYFSEKYPRRSTSPFSVLFRRGEKKRLQAMQQWLPHCECLEILDAGCGDGIFLSSILQGTAMRLRIVDWVSERIAEAKKRLLYKADILEAVVGDVRDSVDDTQYDFVLAFGLFDYERNWPDLLQCLLRRARGTLIADFPKAFTAHDILRRIWLRFQGVPLHSALKAELNRLLDLPDMQIEIVDAPLHWIVKLQKMASKA